jgi:hypothetical protein
MLLFFTSFFSINIIYNTFIALYPLSFLLMVSSLFLLVAISTYVLVVHMFTSKENLTLIHGLYYFCHVAIFLKTTTIQEEIHEQINSYHINRLSSFTHNYNWLSVEDWINNPFLFSAFCYSTIISIITLFIIIFIKNK